MACRGQVRTALLDRIQDAVASMAQQLVEDEVRALVGVPWSRKAAGNPLRRGGRTRRRIALGGEPLVIEKTHGSGTARRAASPRCPRWRRWRAATRWTTTSAR